MYKQINLRWYQSATIKAVSSSLSTNKSMVVVAPTGSGKTIIATDLIGRMSRAKKSVLFVMHRTQLVKQSSEKLSDYGISHSLIVPRSIKKAINDDIMSSLGHSLIQPSSAINIGSIQTLQNRLHILRDYDYILIDECHTSTSSSYIKLFESQPNAKRIGLTATPERTDGTGLDRFYEDIYTVVQPKTLIEEGFLVHPKIISAKHDINWSEVSITRGDFDKDQVADIMGSEKILGDFFSAYWEHAMGRTGIVFCPTVAHAEMMCNAANQQGIRSFWVSAKNEAEERYRVLNELSKNDGCIVFNCGLYTEGLDIPNISFVGLMWRTKSISRYLQSIGRGLRPFLGKTDCIIIDQGSNWIIHGSPTADREWSLQGEVKSSRGAKAEIVQKVCKHCFIVSDRKDWVSHDDGLICPSCGEIEEKSKVEIDIESDANVSLVDVTEEAERREKARIELRALQGKAKTIDDMQKIGIPRNQAAHIIKAREDKFKLASIIVAADPRKKPSSLIRMKPKELKEMIKNMGLTCEDNNV